MRVSILEDIQKIREANFALSENIKLEKVAYGDASRNAESLLRRCEFITNLLNEVGQKEVTELQADLFALQMRVVELLARNLHLDSEIAALRKMHANRLTQKNKEIEVLKDEKKSIEDRLVTLSRKLGSAHKKLGTLDYESLKYRKSIAGKVRRPKAKRNKPRP